MTKANDVADASGNAAVLIVLVLKSGWPNSRVAGLPVAAAGGNTSTRLSLGTATYNSPSPSTARLVGPASEDAVGVAGTARVVNVDCPKTRAAVEAEVTGAWNCSTLAFR